MWTSIKASLLQIIVFCATLVIIDGSSLASRGATLSQEKHSQDKHKKDSRAPLTTELIPEWLSVSRRNRRYVSGSRLRTNMITKNYTNCIVVRLQSKSYVPYVTYIGVNDTKVVGIHDHERGSLNYTLLELQTFNSDVRRIRGYHSGRYVAVDVKGDIVTETTPTTGSFWIERMEKNGWHTFRSFKMVEMERKKPQTPNTREVWYLAVKRNKNMKKPKEAEPGMKSSQFLYYTIQGYDCKPQ